MFEVFSTKEKIKVITILVLLMQAGTSYSNDLENKYSNIIFPSINHGSDQISIPILGNQNFLQIDKSKVFLYYSTGEVNSQRILNITSITGYGIEGVETNTYANYRFIKNKGELAFISPVKYVFDENQIFTGNGEGSQSLMKKVRADLVDLTQYHWAKKTRVCSKERFKSEKGKLYENANRKVYIYEYQCLRNRAHMRSGVVYSAVLDVSGDTARILIENYAEEELDEKLNFTGPIYDLNNDGNIELNLIKSRGLRSSTSVVELINSKYIELTPISTNVEGGGSFPYKKYTDLLSGKTKL